jgi:1-acyl-sn-glycerol-3-phosphate acyltransferase
VEADSTDVFVSWLPLYHDMGLIGAWLGSLYYAGQLILMSPLSFLTRPQRWLWAIHKHRGTLSAAPNFAYELCLNKIDDRDIEGLDLSSWRIAFNGAEPVSPKTILHFKERFARYGLRESAITPVYGLAESTVGLAFSPLHRGPKIDRIRREPFVRTGHALPSDKDDPNALSFVSSGVPLPGHEVRIVNPGGREAGDREEGRLEFMGPSATSGYYRNPEASGGLIHGKWLDSGDLAYATEGEIYITGRFKDVIIRAGRNIYPHELEETVGNVPGIRKGCVAVFGSSDRKSGTEKIVVLAETRETQEEALAKLRNQIENVTVDLLGMPADDIVLAPRHTVLKTSSGKVRRSASRDLYESGAISKGPRAVWRQFARLLWSGLLPQVHRLSRVAADYLYAAYAWALFSLLAPIAWTAVVLLPKFSWRYSILRTLARALVFLSGTSLTVEGKEHLQRLEHCVLVANHASYLDSPILVAALPGNFSYVAKRELTTRFISRTFLRKIRTEFVERFDKQRGMVDARKTSKAVQEGRSLVFFPEGTFYRMPGLHPFHMGAFAAAAEAGVPVVPIAISGTRSILRAGLMFPRRGTVRITICEPIYPEGKDWVSAIKLRDAVRAEILKHCGEPDLTP